MRVAFQLDVSQPIRVIRSIERRAVKTEPAAEAILADMRRMVSRQFATAGAYRGPAWKKLKRETVRQKLRSSDARTRANATRPLQATEAMRRSLTDSRRRSGASTATDDGVVLASNLARAAAHHRGVPARGLPRRPLIRITKQDRERHARILSAHLVGEQR